jgi:hypothetical protein
LAQGEQAAALAGSLLASNSLRSPLLASCWRSISFSRRSRWFSTWSACLVGRE